MTGFGTTQFQVKGISSQVTVRTVNGRYLEVRTHLPRELQNLEIELKNLAKKYFQRGTVDVSLQFANSEALSDYKVDLDRDLARQWVQEAKKLKSSLKLEGDLDLSSLIGLPGVIKTHKSSRIEGAEKSFLKGALKAFKSCEDFRLKEGQALQKNIQQLLSQLESVVKKIGGEQKKLEQEVSKKLKTDMVGEVTVEGRAVLEARASEGLDRMNIEEELTRLSEHIKAVVKLIAEKGPCGKKMDFYAQEFLRETNTIGSKSGCAQITSLVVEGKSLIESFREQVQNIE